MATSKSKLQITTGKSSKVKLGASASTPKPSALMSLAKPKKDYAKKQKDPGEFGSANFGMTGLTGES